MRRFGLLCYSKIPLHSHSASQDPMKAFRFFSTSIAALKYALPPRPSLPDSELHHVYLKGSGPGGQKIVCPAVLERLFRPILTSLQNKTNSAVQITHLPTGIVVKSQATRSRSQNHNIAKQILAEKIELLQKGDESRAAKKIEVKSKRKASATKKSKRKYRALEEAKNDSVATDAAVELESGPHGEGDGTAKDDGKGQVLV
jgi:peptide chain release factor